MRELDASKLDDVAGGAFGQTVGAPTYRPDLSPIRQVFDDGSTFTVSPDGWMSATEGLGPREALLQYRQEGPGMSVNSMQSLADHRGVEMLVNNPGIDTVHIQASGLTFNATGIPVESIQSGATTRAGMGQIFDDGSRIFPGGGYTESFDALQDQITREREQSNAGVGFHNDGLEGWSRSPGPEPEPVRSYVEPQHPFEQEEPSYDMPEE